MKEKKYQHRKKKKKGKREERRREGERGGRRGRQGRERERERDLAHFSFRSASSGLVFQSVRVKYHNTCKTITPVIP